ncbi:MFS transporter [Nocardiopsis halophila]|uniref:MFS transporter n=1 Tax=Nocardiopsis halophila TaxID=141692 RepID=UPI00034BE1F8|nr:MFS transporter [Nocardiopsis halophila]
MLHVLRDGTYRRLFTAQVVALTGTGLATVALALLAYDLAGGAAGTVLGTALTIKMAAYVGISPVIGAVAGRLPRRAFLVAMDLVRAGAALSLPFVDAVWQVYLLILVLQSASAAFTPLYQAALPDVLPRERDYTRALALSRLAYDLESLLSPVMAGALLALTSYQGLFVGTAAGFCASAVLVLASALPKAAAPAGSAPWRAATRGARILLSTPRLRALLALEAAVAAATAIVLVDTVVIVRDVLGRGESAVAAALAFYGAGSMLAALSVSRFVERRGDRAAMLAAAFLVAPVLAATAAATAAPPAVLWPAVLVAWALLGAVTSLILTPAPRLLRRSCAAGDRTALFAARFSLSHAWFLLTYPAAGWAVPLFGLAPALAAFSVLTLAAAVAALLCWPAGDPRSLPHAHADLPPGHPHLRGAQGGTAGSGRRHEHEYLIDDLHPRWPRSAGHAQPGR